MGTWAIDALGNDDAADWLDVLYGGDGFSAIDNALSAALDQSYLEAPDAQVALAAAEVVARLQGHPDASVPPYEELDDWIATSRLVPPSDFVHRAHLVIDRVLAEGSELHELWQDSDDFEAWLSSLENLRSRLVEEAIRL